MTATDEKTPESGDTVASTGRVARVIGPVVDVEFPAKKPGGPPITKRYPLDQFCCDGVYRGPVRVPDDAGAGNAKVTFSFASWRGVKVAPTTVEIPVDGPPAEK